MRTEQTADTIAKAAYNGHEPEGFCDLTDMHLHTCLMQLYTDFREGRITQAQAEAMKLKLVSVWEDEKKTFARWHKMTAEYSENIKKISTFRPEKATTSVECVGILAQMVAALTGDSSLPERLRKQFGE